jgi:hypothetical protein
VELSGRMAQPLGHSNSGARTRRMYRKTDDTSVRLDGLQEPTRRRGALVGNSTPAQTLSSPSNGTPRKTRDERRERGRVTGRYLRLRLHAHATPCINSGTGYLVHERLGQQQGRAATTNFDPTASEATGSESGALDGVTGQLVAAKKENAGQLL